MAQKKAVQKKREETVPVEEAPQESAPAAAPVEPERVPQETVPVEPLKVRMSHMIAEAVKGTCTPTLIQFEQRSGMPRCALVELDEYVVRTLWQMWREENAADQEGFIFTLMELMGAFPARVMRLTAQVKLE